MIGREKAAQPASWRQWIEPWYVAYALLGVTVAGLGPILVPLAVSRGGTATAVGLVMAAISLGGLTAPLWGFLADHLRLHRVVLAGGLVAAATGLAGIAVTRSLAEWLVLAFLNGAGAVATSTVANLFVVEVHPRAEWDQRIGWLQTFYGVGQVGGLLLAGAMGEINIQLGLLLGAGVTGLALIPGWLTTHVPEKPLAARPVLLHPSRHGEWAAHSPQDAYHHLNRKALRQLVMAEHSPFGRFLVLWLLAFAGGAALFSFYPVLMQSVYHVTPALASAVFAVAAALGLALYLPAGHLSKRFGAARILQGALGLRLLAFLGLVVLGLASFAGRDWLALLSFVFVVLAWSFLSVSGTTLTARLTPAGEGEGMGIFNATTALAGVIGAAAGGWVAGQWGYGAVPILSAAGVFAGLILLGVVPSFTETVSPDAKTD